MVRILLGSLLSAVALFVFGMLSWVALGLHEGTIRELPDQSAVAATLGEQELVTGVYSYPAPRKAEPGASAADGQKAMDDWIELRRQGPVFSVFYQAGVPSRLRRQCSAAGSASTSSAR